LEFAAALNLSGLFAHHLAYKFLPTCSALPSASGKKTKNLWLTATDL